LLLGSDDQQESVVIAHAKGFTQLLLLILGDGVFVHSLVAVDQPLHSGALGVVAKLRAVPPPLLDLAAEQSLVVRHLLGERHRTSLEASGYEGRFRGLEYL